MMNNLPDDWGSTLLAFLFLFAAEIGLIIWHETSIGHTTTYTQHGVSVALTWLDFVGSLAAGIGDMIIRQTIMVDYAIPPFLAMFIIFGLPVLVALNVAGAIVYLSNDSDNVKDREKRMLEFEAHKQAIRLLKDNKKKLVQAAKREIYQEIAGVIPPEDPPASPPTTGKNGKDPTQPLRVKALRGRIKNNGKRN
jgi:hypothetical protein